MGAPVFSESMNGMTMGFRAGWAAAAAVLCVACAAPAAADGISDGDAGRTALLAGRYDDAVALFTKSIASGSLSPINQAIAFNLRGYAYMQKGQTQAALDDLNLSLKLGETPDARFNRARVLIGQYHYGEAIDDLNRATALGSRAADVFAYRGHAYLYAGKPDLAIKDLDEAIRQQPDYAFAYLTRGHAYLNSGQDDKAIADETRAIALAPKNVEARWLRAYAYRYHKQAPDKALADYSAALAIDPADDASRNSRADAYEALGRWADAQADYAALILGNPAGAFGYWARGRVTLIQGHAAEAAIDLAKAVSLKPADAYDVIWLHLARRQAGVDDTAELQANSAKVDTAVWPGPVVDYFAGKTGAATVLAKAGLGDGKAQAAQVCEVQMFMGQDDLAQDRKAQGVQRLQQAAKVCDPVSREARLVKAELDRNGAPLPRTVAASSAAKAPITTSAASAKPVIRRPAPTLQAQAAPDPLALRGSLK